MTTAPAVDMGKAQTFAFKLIGDVTAQQMGTLSTIGDRLGLFRVLHEGGPATSEEFAGRAQIQERYAREWLAAMACHGYVAYDDGQALLFLAQAYPNATLVGYDNYAPAVSAANGNATQAGLADRVRYEVWDAARALPGTYDLITTFDVVHDMPRPRPALEHIKGALAPDGTYFVLEFNFSGDLQANIEPPLGIGAFGYSASTNYCITQSLAVGGMATGACMGEAKMRELAAAAGFGRFRRIDFPANPFNLFHEIRP